MSNQNQVTTKKNTVVEQVTAKVQQFQQNGEIHFPPAYSPENALKSAYLMLQNIKTSKNDGNRPVLEVCTKESIANSLLDMVVQGLNPAKKQGYFIAYGNQLTFQRSYMGTMAVTKRVAGVKEINAMPIYEGDEVNYEIQNGKIINLSHKQKFGSINKENIIGAYCTIITKENEIYTELMTIEELRKAWSKAQFWGKDQASEKKGSTHDEFKQEMAKKTVINRACKKFLNSSDDSSLVMQHINRSDEAAEEARVHEEIQQNANSEIIDVEYEVDPEEPKQIEDNTSQQMDVLQSQQEQMEYATTGPNGPGF
ncbi:recombinase RecT [Heyndrickxia sporothermodurans]|uniref:Recombinase RecT n=1 Tax=Heyndrickxia sporothermodurans TaxID=46224 RepID=A0AB37HEJ9_9BACI|nr:recombinase RecT [Heyndrickxia sporothermodurans]MED1711750.1 recombinase RecT [Bacillus thuringiensis]MBL5768008.1 recombinase RecT [Heyndrickxia sporothermodurans]MBL5771601.1 recombinase RecT [Heyndrickxia sporothermodurans]MBL5785887.1 recombinase RecT [Heyndrickxia sporothermodurans]MBL5789393.1 recombinase RecT [Heyndrickxia sporothermodurans]